MKQLRLVVGIFLSKLLGLLIFLVILGLLNFLVPYIKEPFFSGIVLFLNVNLLLILLFGLFFMVSEMFFHLVFPFNLPAPLFSSFGSVFLVTFIFNILNFIDLSFKIGLRGFLNNFYLLIIAIVFFFVFVVGYSMIFSNTINDLRKFKKSIGAGRRKVGFVRDWWVKKGKGDVRRRDSSGFLGLDVRKDRHKKENENEDKDEDEMDSDLEKVDKREIKKRKFKKIPSKKISLKDVSDEIKGK